MITSTLTSRIPLIIEDLPDEIDEALQVISAAIEGMAKQLVPVNTGALRDAIHVEEIEGGYSVIAGDEDVFYGHIVEFGSTRVPPHPFLLPASEMERANLRDRISEALEDI